MNIKVNNLKNILEHINWKESIDKYAKKRSQALLNLKENREHFWFIDLGNESELMKDIDLANMYRSKWFKDIVVIWMWWSTLWTRAIVNFISWNENTYDWHSIHFVDNIDSDIVLKQMRSLDITNSLICFVSKSWTTVETNALFKIYEREVHLFSNRENKDEQFIRIIEEWKVLSSEASNYWKTYKTIYTPKNVWWRFSVFTSSSLFPLAFLYQSNLSHLLEWINKQKEFIFNPDINKNESLKLAVIHYRFNKYWKDWWNALVFFSYSDKLKMLWEWYKQLIWESLWKDWKWLMLFPAVWVVDQHSQLQLFNEWPKDKLVCFLTIKNRMTDLEVPWEKYSLDELMKAEKEWTEQSLIKAWVDNFTIELESSNSFEEIWKLMYMLEFQIAILWEFYWMDVFNQPWVEEWKLITKNILKNKYD